MAMTACRECSASISDQAATCPQCGVSSPGGTCAIQISRVKNMAGRLHPCEVYVNSEHQLELAPGEGASIQLAPGGYQLEVLLSLPAGVKRLYDTVQLKPNALVNYEIQTSMWNGYKLVRM